MNHGKVQIGVIDGHGGGMGRAIVERIKCEYPDVVVRALGTNSLATAAMLKAGADDGASGENAIIFNARKMDILIGPIGIAMANGLLGEVTPAMAGAIMDSAGVKIFLPPQNKCGFHFASGKKAPLPVCIDETMALLREEMHALNSHRT